MEYYTSRVRALIQSFITHMCSVVSLTSPSASPSPSALVTLCISISLLLRVDSCSRYGLFAAGTGPLSAADDCGLDLLREYTHAKKIMRKRQMSATTAPMTIPAMAPPLSPPPPPPVLTDPPPPPPPPLLLVCGQ